ncbi:MAG TPA: hypothetical protein VFM54_24430 [Micromonosporaceae bacterium]|nr:hypothetical protein [Micromonosporaceae bacterium]
MPYWLEGDEFAADPRWEALSGGSPAKTDHLQASYCRLKATAAHIQDGGYLTHGAALQQCHGRRSTLDTLTRPVLGKPPLLHRPGDECECLDEQWVDGYAYRVHAFLKRNPHRKETERARAQKREREEPRIRHLVRTRDGDCCRYCRSGPLSTKAGRARDRRRVLVLDHVDPDELAGPDGDNLVVACGACNEHKGHATPDEAEMLLLPPPTLAEIAAWEQRGLALFERGEYRQDQISDQPPINAGSTPDQRSDQRHEVDPGVDPISDSTVGPAGDPNTVPTGEVRPSGAGSTPGTAPPMTSGGSGLGRGGQPASDRPSDSRCSPPRQPTRSPAHPDVYHRRSRASPANQVEGWWPAGSVPATPRPRDEEDP